MAIKIVDPVKNEEQDSTVRPLGEESENIEEVNTQEINDLPLPTVFSLFCLALSFILNASDVISDVNLVYSYYVNGFIAYFCYTLACLILPALLMTGVSIWINKSKNDNQGSAKGSCEKLLTILTFSMFQLSPLTRYAEAFFYGCKSRITKKPNQKAIQKYLKAYRHANLLSVFTSFSESAPQLTLQLYILITGEVEKFPGLFDTQHAQFLSVGFSLLGIAWSLVSYNRELLPKTIEEGRQSEWKTFFGSGLQFVWFLCTISARVFALAAFGSIHPVLIILMCWIHYVLTAICLTCRKLHLDKEVNCKGLCKLLRDFVIIPTAICPAFVYLFAYFKIEEEKLRHNKCRCLFYLIFLIEDSVLLGIWFVSLAPEVKLFVTEITPNGVTPGMLVLGDYSLFITGLFVMSVYYSTFHATVYDMVMPMQLKNGRVYDVGYCAKNNTLNILPSTNENSLDEDSFISTLLCCFK